MIIQVGFVFYITVLYVALVIYRFEYIATPRIIGSVIDSVV